MELGEKIKMLRKGKYTLEELADKVGVHINTLSRWEKGYRYPTADKLQAIADALGTSTDFLMNKRIEIPEGEKSEVAQEDKAVASTFDEDGMPYLKKSEELNRGMLSLTLKDGVKIDMPPTRESYDFLEKLIRNAASVAVV